MRNPHGSVRPTNRTATPWFGSWGGRTATVRHGSPRFAKPPAVHHGFSWLAIFLHAVFTPTQTYQVSFPSRSILAHCVFSDSCIVNTLFSYLIAFSLHLHPLRIHPRRPSPAFLHTIVLFHPSLTLRIRRTQFCCFRTLEALDGLILAGFAQSQHSTVAVWQLFLSAFSHPAPAPRSRVRSHFCCFRSLSAFNGRILAEFAQSLHSKVTFWQVLHNLCIRWSRFGSISSLRIHPPRTCPPVHAYDWIFAAFAHSQHTTVAFWQVLHNLCIRRSRFGSFSSLPILPPHTCRPFSYTIAFLQLSLTLSIQRSNFGRFCTISAFDGRVLAGFAQFLHSTVAFWLLFLTAFSHTTPATRSRIQSRFCSFRLLSAFNGRVLAGFAQSLHSTVAFWLIFLSTFSDPTPATRSRIQSRFCCFRSLSAFNERVLAGFVQSLHSTVAFWQLFLSAFSHPAPASRSRIRSHFCSFSSLSVFTDRILAGFAQSLHPTVAFWQVLHNLCIRRSHFGRFFSLPHLPPRSRIRSDFAAFAHSQHSTFAFWQVLHNLCIRQSRFGRFCTISAFDGRVLAAFPLSPFSHPAPARHSRIRSHFCRFRSLSAFNGRILAGFAPSPHSTVAFCQLFLSALSNAAPPPCSRVRSHFCYSRTLSACEG